MYSLSKRSSAFCVHDYVIYYKEIEDAEKQIESNRKKFFKKLELEQFDLYFLKQNDVVKKILR